MSYYTSVAVMANMRTDKLLAALQKWADEQERSADFATLGGDRLAADASVIVGEVNHIDLDSLLAVIRDAMRDDWQGSWWPVAVATLSEESAALWFRLDENSGEWL